MNWSLDGPPQGWTGTWVLTTEGGRLLQGARASDPKSDLRIKIKSFDGDPLALTM